jgi:cell division protease FtsH
VIAGPARKSRVISDKERELTAYHEAGHALVAYHMPGADMVWKISIVSRGQTGGYTRYLPEEDRYLQTLTQFLAMLATAMGGRQAEVIKFGEVTTGASNDIEVATRMARQMVTRYGMSPKLGLRSFGRRQEAIFLGREISEERDYSIRTENLIDSEVSRLLNEGRDTANQILSDHTDQLDKLAQFLLEYETIDGDQMTVLLEGGDPLSLRPPRPEPVGPVGDEETADDERTAAPAADPEPQTL